MRELAGGFRTGNPILDTGLKFFLDTAIGREPEDDEEEDEGQASDEAKAAFLQRVVALETGLLLIIGTKGTGKTGLSMKLLELYGEQGLPLYVLGAGPMAPHIEEVRDLAEIKNKGAVVLDDANLVFNAQSYGSKEARVLQALITLSRHKDLIIIANAHNTASVNRYLLQADALFLKPQNALSSGYERREVLPLILEAHQHFQGMSQKEVERHVYAIGLSMYVPPFRGMVRYTIPPWYTAKQSKNKALV